MAAKTFKTKPFLLATAGSTVDGRVISEKEIKEMAESYDPKTYGARVNIEHIRGISGDGPFHAYGDLVALSTGEVDVNFNGQTEKRLGLFGTFEFLENAKALNNAGQKVYPSIEIAPDFAGKGYAYCMGVALTDSPAAIGTERLQFNRVDPSRLHLTGDQSAALEFVEDALPNTPAADGFFKALTDLLKPFGRQQETPPAPPVESSPASAPDMAAFTAVFEGFARKMDETFAAYATSHQAAITAIKSQVEALSAQIENTPGNAPQRPLGTGTQHNFALTDC